MRADRIIVGEARGAEMMDVLQAMRCGHDGSMTTIHASSTEDLIERAVTIALFANLGILDSSVCRLVVDGLDLIVMLFRFGDGRRRMTRITEPYWTTDGRGRLQRPLRAPASSRQPAPVASLAPGAVVLASD